MDALNTVDFRFQISDWTLLTVRRKMLVRNFGIGDTTSDRSVMQMPLDCVGVMLRSVQSDASRTSVERQIIEGQPVLRYVMQCFPRYYIDMSQSFDSYKKKFSSKTLSTIRRKVKKFAEHCGGEIRWESFSRPDELERFWRLARELSSKTYQERLLDSGLPSSSSFIERAKRLAEQDDVRGYLLFDGQKPVSYLYCPVENGLVQYAYLGYDPSYLRFSVGTILQWLALESLFEEGRFQYFDFTEGESEHKRLFSTGYLNCANIALLRSSLRNNALALAHLWFGRMIASLGGWLDRHDLRARVRRWIRLRPSDVLIRR